VRAQPSSEPAIWIPAFARMSGVGAWASPAAETSDLPLRLPLSPLVPANAGTQGQPRGRWRGAVRVQPGSEPAIWIPAFAGMSGVGAYAPPAAETSDLPLRLPPLTARPGERRDPGPAAGSMDRRCARAAQL